MVSYSVDYPSVSDCLCVSWLDVVTDFRRKYYESEIPFPSYYIMATDNSVTLLVNLDVSVKIVPAMFFQYTIIIFLVLDSIRNESLNLFLTQEVG